MKQVPVPVFGLTVVFFVPLRKLPQSFPQRNFRCKSEVTFKGGGIGIRRGDITWLHRDELFVGLEVEVCGKDTGTYQFFLQDIHEVEKIFWLAATNVVDGIGRDR